MRGASLESIPKGYEKLFTETVDGITFETYYNPNEKDVSKAYIKRESS